MGMNIETLKGLTITSIEGMEKGSYEVVFTTADGRQFKMLHYQDCCEDVLLDDVCGDPEDLIGSPVIMAYETSEPYQGRYLEDYYIDSGTWTFYSISTIKGSVTLRWLGTSNGYYSEHVEVEELT